MNKIILLLPLALLMGCVNIDNHKSMAENKKENSLICRSEALIGTNIKQRVCRTRAQLDNQAKESQETLRERSAGEGNGGNSR